MPRRRGVDPVVRSDGHPGRDDLTMLQLFMIVAENAPNAAVSIRISSGNAAHRRAPADRAQAEDRDEIAAAEPRATPGLGPGTGRSG